MRTDGTLLITLHLLEEEGEAGTTGSEPRASLQILHQNAARLWLSVGPWSRVPNVRVVLWEDCGQYNYRLNLGEVTGLVLQ